MSKPQPCATWCSLSRPRATSSLHAGQRTKTCSHVVARCSLRAPRLPVHVHPADRNGHAHRKFDTRAAASRSGTASLREVGARQHGQRWPACVNASSRQQRQKMCLRSNGRHARLVSNAQARVVAPRFQSYPHGIRLSWRNTSKQMPHTRFGSGLVSESSDAIRKPPQRSAPGRHLGRK